METILAVKSLKMRTILLTRATLAGFVLAAGLFQGVAWALPPPDALPDFSPFTCATPPCDPRLEFIPADPINLKNITAFAGHSRLDGTHPPQITGRKITMRFPPRVNGQTHSNGDRHADMYVLFDATTGVRVNQPFILEAVPNGATGGPVSDLKARNFSAIWELHVVQVSSLYDPTVLDTRIDSELKVLTSPFVQKIIQTNIFINCPVVPIGSTVDSGSRLPEEAFFEGQLVSIVFYDTEDGGVNPQALFKFEDSLHNTIESTDPANPVGTAHLVASRLPGDPFYTALWEVLTITVDDLAAANASLAAIGSSVVLSADNDLAKLTARAQFVNPDTGAPRPGFTMKSAGIRLNCPVIEMESAPGSGVMMPVPIEDPVALLTKGGVFNLKKFPFDLYPKTFSNGVDRATVLRTFAISEINLPAPPPAEPTAGSVAASFPPVDPSFKDNVIPLILEDAYQLQSSGPNSSGPIHRINQADLDGSLADGAYPSAAGNTDGWLPAFFENRFDTLIADGMLGPEWAQGVKPYQDRLALLGRAIFELVWTVDQGFGPKDVSNCMACHSQPAFGGAARGLYNFQGRDAGLMINPGSMFGSGGAELLVRLKKGLSQDSPLYPEPALAAIASGNMRGPHGSQGATGGGSMRLALGAANTHFGIQASEFVGTNSLCVGACAALTIFGTVGVPSTRFNPDFDFEQFGGTASSPSSGDGAVNEKSVGEVTAETAFLLTLPAPDEASASAKALLRVSNSAVQSGKNLFRKRLDNGGAGCAACHTVFHKMDTDVLNLTNPETGIALPLKVSTHTADANDVADATVGFCATGPNQAGCAEFVGQMGLRTYGDFKIHKMGSRMSNSGNQLLKTAECWDCGISFPYLRAGEYGAASLKQAILVHEGSNVSGASITRGVQTNAAGVTSQVVTIKNNSGTTWGLHGDPKTLDTSSGLPIRVILVGSITPGVQLTNADGQGPEGGNRHGAYKTWAATVPFGGTVTLTFMFSNPSGAAVKYGLAIQDNAGYSEAVASAYKFKSLPSGNIFQVVSFLRAQLIADKIVEGSGGKGIPAATP